MYTSECIASESITSESIPSESIPSEDLTDILFIVIGISTSVVGWRRLQGIEFSGFEVKLASFLLLIVALAPAHYISAFIYGLSNWV
jgi:hypothetical protein